MLITKGNKRDLDPVLTKCSLGLGSWLGLDPPRVKEQQNLSLDFDTLHSTVLSTGSSNVGLCCPVHWTLHLKDPLSL